MILPMASVAIKGDCLLSALHTGFQKMEELGANRKALIFTESTRTQLYLKQLLEENGYMGKIVPSMVPTMMKLPGRYIRHGKSGI